MKTIFDVSVYMCGLQWTFRVLKGSVNGESLESCFVDGKGCRWFFYMERPSAVGIHKLYGVLKCIISKLVLSIKQQHNMKFYQTYY